MKKLLPFVLLALLYFCASAQAQTDQICVTSPSQTANYNQLCITASAAGGAVGVNNFGTATGGLGVGTITSGTWQGSPISNPYLLNPFTTINGTTCNLGASCTVSAPTSGVVVGTSTITGGTTNQILYDNGGVLGEITKGNSCIYGTSSGGVPSCLTTLPSGLTLPGLIASSASVAGLTVTSSFTATGLVTNADLVSPTVTVNTVSCTLGSSCTITASASLIVGSSSVTSGTTNQLLYDNGGTLGEVTKGNSCVYGTNGTGVPSCVTTLPFSVSLATGGTNANLSASTGGIVYSGASALAILAGTATANLPLLSGSSAAPTWAMIAYPTSANSGGIPYFSSSSVISSSNALGANCIVYGGGTGTAPATSATGCPTVSNAGLVAVPNATASSASNNGALVVTGGLGVGGAINTGGNIVATTGTISAGNSGASVGSMGMNAGDAVHSGYMQWFTPGGTRIAFMGFDTGSASLTMNLNASTFNITGGGVNMASLPSSAGSGGLYVCADNTGTLYKKSACP